METKELTFDAAMGLVGGEMSFDWGEWNDLVVDENIQAGSAAMTDGGVYRANITDLQVIPKPEKDKDNGKDDYVRLRYTISLKMSDDDNAERWERGMRDLWITKGQRGPDVRQLTKLIKCTQLHVSNPEAFRKYTDHNNEQQMVPSYTAEHPFQWWADAVKGQPLMVVAKAFDYTNHQGETKKTFRFFAHSQWADGEVL